MDLEFAKLLTVVHMSITGTLREQWRIHARTDFESFNFTKRSRKEMIRCGLSRQITVNEKCLGPRSASSITGLL
ncbi:hypothetical protein ABKN59_005450 [Abortiporus biennis]